MDTRPANDNQPDEGFAFQIGETIEVMTRAVIIERSESASGRTYLVRATKEDGREIYIRAAETEIFEPEPVRVAAERVAA
ncbi:hypothetical protein [Devosia elaeis]|uniref:Uncharacterized protein n=1 Tax=Devosia elaeis TaxID=1770058 RepID=A0A178HZD9_9HYPH|nr:hypothetical protein [Devosia elaeis]OAM78202.1 hypothetical protein A3840_06775 [Devosia elaeis]